MGLGKTHLLHSIANELIGSKKEINVVLASSEKFTNDFIASIQENKTLDFSKVYRNADVLLIDDIQFFQGKEQTQEQFFHTFNELYTNGKQIVMTADRYPGEMVDFKTGCCLGLSLGFMQIFNHQTLKQGLPYSQQKPNKII